MGIQVSDRVENMWEKEKLLIMCNFDCVLFALYSTILSFHDPLAKNLEKTFREKEKKPKISIFAFTYCVLLQ